MDGVGARTMLIKKKKTPFRGWTAFLAARKVIPKLLENKKWKDTANIKAKAQISKKKKKALTRYSVGSAPLNSVRTSLLKGEHSSNHPPPRMRIKGHAADLINHTFLLTATKKKRRKWKPTLRLLSFHYLCFPLYTSLTALTLCFRRGKKKKVVFFFSFFLLLRFQIITFFLKVVLSNKSSGVMVN